MKVYISADIEGVAGIAHSDEANKTLPSYTEFREEMTNEVVAACEAAIDAGATEVLIKDAHATGRNILTKALPACARIIRGWSGHPLCMVQEIDQSFDAVFFIGYHSKGGAETNPLAHTLSGGKVAQIKLNDEIASEFLLHAYAASLHRVPIAFLAGDEQICREAKTYVPNISTVATLAGVGASTISIAPKLALAQIRERVAAALTGDLNRCRLSLPKHFKLQITYGTPVEAYRASWYPGVKHPEPMNVTYETDDYFEVLRALRFIVLG